MVAASGPAGGASGATGGVGVAGDFEEAARDEVARVGEHREVAFRRMALAPRVPTCVHSSPVKCSGERAVTGGEIRLSSASDSSLLPSPSPAMCAMPGAVRSPLLPLACDAPLRAGWLPFGAELNLPDARAVRLRSNSSSSRSCRSASLDLASAAAFARRSASFVAPAAVAAPDAPASECATAVSRAATRTRTSSRGWCGQRTGDSLNKRADDDRSLC
jgi:hypothetical protein